MNTTRATTDFDALIDAFPAMARMTMRDALPTFSAAPAGVVDRELLSALISVVVLLYFEQHHQVLQGKGREGAAVEQTQEIVAGALAGAMFNSGAAVRRGGASAVEAVGEFCAIVERQLLGRVKSFVAEGGADGVTSFARDADGRLAVETFDFREHLNGRPAS